MIKICPICNIEFKTRKSRKVFCSAECRAKGNHLIVEKRKKSMLEKYGVENPLHSKEIKEKIKKTNLEKYGVENPAQNKEVYEKVKQTNLKKYGFTSATKNKDVKKKIEKTNLEKYGVKTNLMIDECKEQIKQTNLEKYGVEYHTQQHVKHYENYNEIFIKEKFIKNNYFLADDFCNYFGLSRSNVYRYKSQFNINVSNKPIRNKSQSKIYDWIFNLLGNDKVILNDRNVIGPLELDIYIPEKKLAIEYNGLLYHSYGTVPDFIGKITKEDSKRLVKKLDICEKKGIKLFNIFENEWLDFNKRGIWESKIMLELGFIDNKINARDCKIREVPSSTVRYFLELNHLQGYAPSSVNLGLYYKDELVEIMTFGKSRFNKNFEWELLRNCTKVNTIVRGGFSKLLSYFKKKYKGSIISYGNRRWTSKIKNVYGEELINVTDPNYFYFHNRELILKSRQQFQKHKLKDKLENFDPNLSETENMYNNGYRKIYDCGNLVYKI